MKKTTRVILQLFGVAVLAAVIVAIFLAISSVSVPNKSAGAEGVTTNELLPIEPATKDAFEDVSEEPLEIVEIVEEVFLDDDEEDIGEEPEEDELIVEEVLDNLPMDSVLDDYEDYDPELVKDIQRALKRRGYEVSTDGIFGPKTGMAVKRFQRAKGLTIDGIVGTNTLKALGLEDNDQHPRYAPNLRTAFEKSDSGRAIHLNLGSHKVEAWEKKDGEWHLIRVMLAATGNVKKGNFTDLCNVKLAKTPREGSRIGGDGWRGNYATPITHGDYFHSILQHPKNGSWTYESESVLGKNVTHGCVRLAVDDAKWLQSFAKAGTVIVVDDRAWNYAAE